MKKLYVAPHGSNENTGSKKKPFATIQHALDVATARDKDHGIAIVGSGEYVVNLLDDE